MASDVKVIVEDTPNPNAVKFTLNRTVSAQGKTYRDAATADVEWIKRLLAIAGVTQVFTVSNFISITKNPSVRWETIIPPAETIVRSAFGQT